MGCADSKLDALEAVSLCRSRADLLADAIHNRYNLAAAHAAYAASLRSFGASLHHILLLGTNDHPLHLPPHRKGYLPSPRPSNSHSRSHSGGSHIQFHPSDHSEGSGSGSVSPFHSSCSSPVHDHPGPTFANIHYARGQPPAPSVSFEHRPDSPRTVQFASVEPSSFYPYYNYSDSQAYQPNYYGYGEMGGFFDSSSPPLAASLPARNVAGGTDNSSSTLKEPPPPPSPPRASAWDFLNPFESQEIYYPSYTPSRSSREVREEEGIPELEELEEEVVKEAYGDPKSLSSTPAGNVGEYSSKVPSSSKNNGVGSYAGGSHYRSRSGVSATTSSTEEDEHVVEKNVAHEERRSMAAINAPLGNLNGNVAVGEIKAQFDRAYESAIELSRLLEVGKHPYHQKNSVYEASSRMMCVMAPPSSSSNGDLMKFDEDIVMNSRNLSSTLQKLYIWEKKLYEEVRAEEKMRLLHEKNCKQLKHLDEKGAEANKIDSTRALINKLSTKIRISIKVVDSISNKINKLRDEELCQQINELILGFIRMWRAMLECHRNQCQAISESKSLDSIANMGKLGESHMNAVMQLELELLRWTSNFSDWINAQKSFVKALNGWLVLCLHYEPEVTPDGVPPYSPGRIGAPCVFVICNNWAQAMDRISDSDVVETMRAFAANVRLLWEQNEVGHTQRTLKAQERAQLVIHKELDALNKKLVLVPGRNGPHRSAEVGSLQLGLKQVFEAMENFTASSMKAYEEARENLTVQ